VPPMRVIKGLDVIEERKPGRFARRKSVTHQELRLERSEEGLGESVLQGSQIHVIPLVDSRFGLRIPFIHCRGV